MNTPDTTKLVADPKRTKLVRIKALADIRLSDGKILKPGEIAEVSESDAAEFCSHPKAEGHYAFSGTRPESEVARHSMQRASRL